MDPTSLSPDLRTALRGAFGELPIEELAPLPGGRSATVLLSFSVDGRPYVLRQGDPRRAASEAMCMQIASDREVAPRLVHAEVRTAVYVLERAPMMPSPRDDAWRSRAAATLRRLHEGPAFPETASMLELVRAFEQGAKRSTRMADVLGMLEELGPCVARFDGTAPCHNDLNPTNVLDSGERVVLVDWETAGQGDPFFDVAQLGVFTSPRPEQGEALLHAYLGRAPTPVERARVAVNRVRALGVYAAAFARLGLLAQERGAPAAPLAEVPAPLPLPELLVRLGKAQGQLDPAWVELSLHAEMMAARASDEVRAAKATLSAD